MSTAYNQAMDSELQSFRSSLPPPPPYSGPAPAARAPTFGSNAEFQFAPFTQTQNRPRLPEEKRNPFLGELPEDVSIVKFQTIVREERQIVIGRIKLPTPGNSHAFILRRYDTDAISLTSMFKVAFPGATEDEEWRETDWVKSSFDTRGMNGGRETPEHVRLAGQWVSRHLAVYLAPAYNLTDLITAIARAHPEPHLPYHRSQRSQIAGDAISRTGPPVPSLATPSGVQPAAKRVRNASPIQAEGANDTRHITVEATTTITGPAGAPIDVERQIAEAKQLVADATRQLELATAAGRALEDQGVAVPINTRGQKRGQADVDGGIAISGGLGGKTERVIRTNKKVQAAAGGEAGRKIAWGAVMFGLGVGAAAFIPQIASQVPAFASQFF